MKIAILGFDIEGKASYEYYTRLGHTVTVHDQNESVQVPTGAACVLGDSYLDNLGAYDLLIRTPGLHPDKILAKNPSVGDKIWSGTNEFFKVCPTKNIIGVTGTKGKGTTCTLITKMLETAGKTVHLGGNIGTPALALLDSIQPDDWVVLELSSFQLQDLRHSPHIAVCLLVVPEHLDIHGNMDSYIAAKKQLFEHQSTDDVAIYFAKSKLSHTIASTSPGSLVPYYKSPGAHVSADKVMIENQEICKTSDIALLGEHNWQNVCAAVAAAWQVTQNTDAIRTAITNFTGLPHRLELVREVGGVRYYNDSFSTGLHATEAAINAVPGPLVAIVGGFERHLPLESFASFAASASNVRQFLVIGQSGKRLMNAFVNAGVKNATESQAKTMNEVLEDARHIAKQGDAILLSPGFASFDMFKNFEERGDHFRTIVNDLP